MSELLITSSVLILAVLLLRQLLRHRVSPRLIYALWAIVALRFLIPVSLPAQSSVMNSSAAQSAQRFLTGQVVYVTPQNGTTTQTITVDPGTLNEQPAPDLSHILPIIWAAGAGCMALWFIWINGCFYGKLRSTRIPLPFKEALTVYQAEGMPSPCLFGLWKPAIYLTPQVTQNSQLCQYVITHELCHWKQKDQLWAAVRGLCLILYWFHPLVWVAAYYSRIDCELACDDRVVSLLGEEKKLDYGKALVDLVAQRSALANFGCAATTMAMGPGKMKERISFIIHHPHTAAPAFLVVVLSVALLVSCTFTGEVSLTQQEALDRLMESIQYENSTISFTIPIGYDQPEDWNIQVYGRAKMGDDGYMSVHLFEEENQAHSWQKGATYPIDLGQTQYVELWLDAQLEGGEQGMAVDLLDVANGGPVVSAVPEGYRTVAVQFPLYDMEGAPVLVTEAQPFTAQLQLPQGWSVTLPETTEANRQILNLYSQAEIWEGETYVGTIGFNRYEPYDGGDIPPEEQYKTVYYELRLSSFEVWDPYTAVRTDDTGESGIANVTYKDQDYMLEHPDVSAAGVPSFETKGILCWNSEITTYVGIRFSPDYPIDDTTLQTIAQEIVLIPDGESPIPDWDYGPTGRRYPGAYSTLRDYSQVQVMDGDGNDITGIAIDLWYCASEAYDVDDTVLFSIGDMESILDTYPPFYELLNYEETISKIFTPEAIAVYESSPVVVIQKTEDGKVWRLGPWKTGYAYGFALSDLETVSATKDQVVLRAIYETNDGGIDRYENPNYQPNYDSVNFTIQKIDGVWYVSDYTYPEAPFPAE